MHGPKAIKATKLIAGAIVILCTAIFGLPHVMYICGAVLVASSVLENIAVDIAQISAYVFILADAFLTGRRPDAWMALTAAMFLICVISHGFNISLLYKKRKSFSKKSKIIMMLEQAISACGGIATFICVEGMFSMTDGVRTESLPCVSAVLAVYTACRCMSLSASGRLATRELKPHSVVSCVAVLGLLLTDPGTALPGTADIHAGTYLTVIVKAAFILFCAVHCLMVFLSDKSRQQGRGRAKDCIRQASVAVLVSGAMYMFALIAALAMDINVAWFGAGPSRSTAIGTALTDFFFRHEGIFVLFICVAAVMTGITGLRKPDQKDDRPGLLSCTALICGSAAVSLHISYVGDFEIFQNGIPVFFRVLSLIMPCALAGVSAACFSELLPGSIRKGERMFGTIAAIVSNAICCTFFFLTIGSSGISHLFSLLLYACCVATSVACMYMKDTNICIFLHGLTAMEGILILIFARPSWSAGGDKNVISLLTCLIFIALHIISGVIIYVRQKTREEKKKKQNAYAAMSSPLAIASLAQQELPSQITPEGILDAAEKVLENFRKITGEPCGGKLLYDAAIYEESMNMTDAAILLYTCAAMRGDKNALNTLLLMGTNDSNYFIDMINA